MIIINKNTYIKKITIKIKLIIIIQVFLLSFYQQCKIPNFFFFTFYEILINEKLKFVSQVTPIPTTPLPTSSTGLKSRIRKVFRTSSGPDRSSFSLVSQLTSAALCASSPALPKNGQVPPVVKSLLRPLSVPQLRYELVT